MLKVTILSVLQGVAEFLPISSSGHLVIGQHLLGLEESGMRLNVFLHLGTLFSIVIFYFSRLVRIALFKDWRYLLKILISAFPAVLVYFLFNDFIDGIFANVKMVGALLMFTGAVLVGTRFLPQGKKDVSFLRALLMGLGQALALLPGVSRSGMTLASARGGGVDPEKSAEFSFLMSAPLIAGASMLEVLKAMGGETLGADVSWPLTIYGCLLSAVVGYFSLKLLVMTLKGRWFWLFGPYCIFVGILTVICG
jgi:undecaprenyl-diphosphatase